MRISYQCFDCEKTYTVSTEDAHTANLNNTYVGCHYCDGGNDPYDYIVTPAMEALGTTAIDDAIDTITPSLRNVLRHI